MVCMVIGQGLSEISKLPLCSQDIVMAHHVNAMLLESLLSPRPSLRDRWAWFLSCQGIWSIICIMTLDSLVPFQNSGRTLNSNYPFSMYLCPECCDKEFAPMAKLKLLSGRNCTCFPWCKHTIIAWKRNGVECRVTIESREPQGANGTAYSFEIKQNSPQGVATRNKTKRFSSPLLTNGTGDVARVVERLLNIHEALGLMPALHKPDIFMYTPVTPLLGRQRQEAFKVIHASIASFWPAGNVWDLS